MNYVLNIPVEVQHETEWCWAAVSTMAVKSFKNVPDLAQMTQLKTVAYALNQVRTKTQLNDYQTQADVNATALHCSTAGNCNLPSAPWLYEVAYNEVPPGKKLKKQRLIDEILADRPVIIMWNYSSVPREDAEDEEDEEDDAEDRLPGGKHYLIITGYDDATDQFRVFDPWLGQGSMPDEPELHEYYISYEGYADPKVSLGLPVTAVHAEDYYNLRRFVVDAPQAILGSGDFVQDTPEPVVLEAAGFDEILHLSHEIQALAHQRIVYAHDGSPVAGTKRAGEAFPIVALTTRQVIEADGAPHRLLIQRAWALIAPVVAGGRIIDSFQMYRTEGKWKQGGYANARVAQLMIKAAEKLRGELGDQQQLYLVSIPEQVMFFAAGGEGATAKLVSLDNDAKGPILAAKDALDGVLKVIRRQRKDPMGRRPPPRPRPR